MTTSHPAAGQWQERLRQQRLNNARVWLERLKTEKDLADLAIEEYGNLLRALETAVADPHAFELAFALIEALFPHSFNFGDWERWLHYLKQALRHSRDLSLRYAEARLQDQIGDLEREMGNTAVAEAVYQQAIELFQELKETSRQAQVLVKLASLYGLQGRLAECQAIRRQVDAISQFVADTTIRPLVHLGLSYLLTFEANWGRVLAEAESAAAALRDQGRTMHEIRALNNIALANTELGNWEEAEAIMGRLTELLTAQEDYVTLSTVKINLGRVTFEKGAYQQAEAQWHEALQLQTRIKGKEYEAVLLNNLGMVYTQLGEWDEALKMLNEAAAHYQEKSDLPGWANVLDNLVDLYEAQGNRAAAAATLEKILAALANKRGDPAFEAIYTPAAARLDTLLSPDSG